MSEFLNNKVKDNGQIDKEIKENNHSKDAKHRITFLRLVQCFIICSVIGLLIETIFCLMIEGVFESRKNFLYGPFSCIYGLGAVVMILILSRFSKNKYALFFGGILVGSTLEYGVSLFGELIYNVKWWDYSNIPFNINGRICLLFSVMWGLLAVYFISYFHPKVESFLDKITPKFLKISTIVMIVFLIANFLVTSFALKVFFTRIVQDYNLEIKDNSQVLMHYDKWCENESFKYITDTFFSNEIMLKTFPNLRITLNNNKVIYTRELFPEIEPFYFRIFEVPIKIDFDNIIN